MKKNAVFAVASLWCAGAMAAGFGLYEVDAHSTAMGGHVFASPRNASAVYYNPGAMQSLTGTVITVGATIINPRADARIDKRHDRHMSPGWLAFPTFFATQELPWGFHLGFGGFADFGIASEYDRNWELKYDSAKTLFEGYTLQGVISYDITRDWSFGIGPRITYVNFETEMFRDFGFVDQMYLAQSHGYMHAPVRGRNRLKIKANNEDDLGVGLAAGTSYRVTDDFSVGAMYRSRVKTKVKGDAVWRGEDVSYNRNTLSETIQLPAQVSLGFNWDDALWIDDLHLGASATWIEWSKMSALVFNVFNPVTGNVEEQRKNLSWRNTYRVGFGLGYDVLDNWTVMAGYTYDWDPCRNRLGYAHTMLPVGDRHIVTTGLAWTSDDGKWQIAVGYALIIMESKTQYIPGEYYAQTREVHKMHTRNSYSNLITVGLTYRF